jgi:phosphatidate cytidylyltransferase
VEINKLGWRFITGISLFVALVVSLAFHDLIFVVLLAAVLAISQFEFWQAFKSQGFETPLIGIELASLALVIVSYLFGNNFWTYFTFIVCCVFIGIMVFFNLGVTQKPKRGSAWLNWLLGSFALFYISGLICSLIWILPFYQGNWKALIAISVPLAADIGAFATGSSLGHNKLFPSISPNKTVEGLIGGFLAALVIAYLFFGILIPQSFNWWRPLIFGLVGATFGTLGDLLESFIKRKLGLKDFSDLLWGHGGFLDRIDSVILTSPTMFILFALL